MDRNGQDLADRIGRQISAVFIVLLIGAFAYGYLWPFFG